MYGGDLDDRFPAERIPAAMKQWLDEQHQKLPDGTATAGAINCSR